MATITKTVCDIHKCNNESNIKSKNVSIIWLTEQTEGRSINPSLGFGNLDLCPECIEKIIKGNLIYATGAQGYNEYVLSYPELTKKLLQIVKECNEIFIDKEIEILVTLQKDIDELPLIV